MKRVRENKYEKRIKSFLMAAMMTLAVLVSAFGNANVAAAVAVAGAVAVAAGKKNKKNEK